ncbi:MAG: ABC transporter permease [Gemmatimonadetes bacterium]|nr:ABC transporter permease [Gemmatimonadota bacterium]
MRAWIRRWCALTGAVILTAPVLHVQGQGLRTIAIDERLGMAAGLAVGDSVRFAAMASAPSGQWVRIGAITRRSADPSEIARSEYRVRLHLDQLQSLTGVGDRIGRFAVRTQENAGAPGSASGTVAGPDSVSAAINAMAFGFRAYPAAEVAIETSATFRVVNRFHRAIGIITIVASAIFLLCITLLKVDERRREVGALRLLGLSRATVVRSVMLEASLIALLGSALGAGFGAAASAIVNWYYQGVYATPLRFALVTPEIVAIAVTLSLLLGIVSGYLAAQRLVRTAPLELVGR